MSALPPGFSRRVIDWQRQHGRHDLPWQQSRDPYRVWLSEVMLQQTQVQTVLAYYPRFLARFPDVRQLAAAPLEDVLALWSGLGYYSRARNLHRCAQLVVARHGGRFPESVQALSALPGIGRSTAAAIAAFCFGQREAILDGNVKRLLSRSLGFDENLSQPAAVQLLWQQAERLLPRRDLARDMPAYTQGLMDLGATVCTRSRPSCADCPLLQLCVAARQGDPERYPVKTRRLRRSQQDWWLLHASDAQGRVWLLQRPARGIWAGLFCLPVHESREALLQSLAASGLSSAQLAGVQEHRPFRHVLTHRDLDLHVISLQISPHWPPAAALPGEGRWFDAGAWSGLGLPAPIRRILDTVKLPINSALI